MKGLQICLRTLNTVQRLQYLGDTQQNCTVRLSHVTQKDEHEYYFRFTTNKDNSKWTGKPGVTLTVTGDFDEVSLSSVHYVE